jgi:hypothetical protein
MVVFNDRIVSGATWPERGPALACLSLLESGYYVLNPAGRTILNPERSR